MEIEAMLSGEFLRDTAKYISMHAYMYVTYTCIYSMYLKEIECYLLTSFRMFRIKCMYVTDMH